MTMPAESLAPTPAPMGPPPASAPAPVEAPPTQPTPAPLVGADATNQLPPESLTGAYKAGALQFRAGERVPVRLASGKIGTVPAESASDVVNAGGEIIPHAVVEHARLSKEYGGAGGTFGAGIAGAARGASIGVSDPIAIAAARLSGGDEGAAKMRERLNAYRELSPVASAVGEVAGMVAPALLTGGISAEAEGVGALARGAGIAAALPVDAVSAAGRLGERGVAALLPELGEGLLARATGKVATKGAGAAIEGALFGAGQEISESSLGDESLTAEKLLASMGHGAVVAGLIGGGLGGAGEVASDALVRAKASPFLAHQAGVQAWKSLDPLKKYTKEAEARFDGGFAGVGRTLLDLDVIPKDAGLAGAALTPQELLPRVEQRLDEQGKKIGEILDKSGATVKLSDLNAQIDEIIRPLKSKAGFGHIAKAVEAYRDDLFDKLTATLDEGEVAAGRVAPKLEIPKHLEAQRTQIEKLGEAAARGEPEAMHVLDWMGVKRSTEIVAPETGILDREVPVTALFAQKRALGDLVYKEAKALDPSQRVEQLRAIYGRLSDLELDAIERVANSRGFAAAKAAGGGAAIGSRGTAGAAATEAWNAAWNAAGANSRGFAAAKAAGGGAAIGSRGTAGAAATEAWNAAWNAAGGGKAELLTARKNYQALSIAKKALDETSARMATNRNLGLSEYMTAGMAAASGHVLAAPVVAIAHKVARARGNAFLAATYDRLSALQTLAKRSAGVDRDLNAGVKAFMGRAKGGATKGLEIGSPPVAATGTETAREEFERRVTDLDAAQGEDHGAPVAALAAHAPTVAGRFRDAATMATQWLALQVPKAPPIGSQTPSSQDVHRFLLQARAVDNPAGTIASGLARGDLSPIETAAIRDCGAYPSLLAEVQQRIHVEAIKAAKSEPNGKLPYAVRRDMALLFDVPEWSMSAEGVRTLQDNTKPPAGGAGDGGGGPQGGPAPKRPMPANAEQLMSGSERLAGGQIRET